VKSFLISACIFLIPVCLLASAPDNSKDSGGQTRPPSTPTQSTTSSDPGERVFTTNCARCHNPPMALPPRITGTVLMHMRVRARLSREDEKLLLHFMAP
jgi:cytochrome c5